MPSSLENAVMHAISFLTSPLINKHDPNTIDALHAALMQNLIAFYAPSWSESNPALGAKQRVLSFSPDQLPPAPIWRSARMVGMLWTPWIASLGNFAFDLCVDPGCVAFKIGAWGSVHVIWQEQPSAFTMKRKTLAQSIIDDEENAIFDLIDHEVSSTKSSSTSSRQSRSSATISSNSSAWMAPLLDQFPTIPQSTSSSVRASPSVVASSISRSSSRASMISSSGFSFSSAETSSSYGSMSSFSSSRSSLDMPNSKPQHLPQRSRRSRPRIPPVFVDPSKKEVTNYDGGKTTVLTGGVMLGNPTKTSKPRNTGRW